MPSFQHHLLSLFMRLYFKRRPPANDTEFVRLARAKLQPPRLLKTAVPDEVRLTPINEHNVRGEWVEWRELPAPHTVFYLHGGGYVGCSPRTHRAFSTALARAAQARIFMLEYRLVPEYHFPAPVEDAVHAYRWLLAQGVQPPNLVLGGDSAGGGLALATLVALREAGLPLPKAAFALSPWTDLAGTGASLQRNENTDPMFYAESVPRFAQLYLNGAPSAEPLASPLYADLRGLPPLLLYASSSEVLLDDAVRLAERARAAGVAVELRLGQRLLHAWPVFYRFLPEAAETIDELGAFVRAQLTGQS